MHAVALHALPRWAGKVNKEVPCTSRGFARHAIVHQDAWQMLDVGRLADARCWACMQDGQTPLHMAASGRLDGDLEGRLACIALLLSSKANVELPDKVHPPVLLCLLIYTNTPALSAGMTPCYVC